MEDNNDQDFKLDFAPGIGSKFFDDDGRIKPTVNELGSIREDISNMVSLKVSKLIDHLSRCLGHERGTVKFLAILSCLYLVGVGLSIVFFLVVGTTIESLFVFGSILFTLKFIFGGTLNTTLRAMEFFFVMHPFDIGDRCEIDGVELIVEEMHILTTVFLRNDNLLVIYANSVLSTKLIANYCRSPDMEDTIVFYIPISTPTEKITTMEERITRYVENKKDHWHQAPRVLMTDILFNRMKFTLWVSHTMNAQDMKEILARRAVLVKEVFNIIKDLDIQ